MTEHVNFSKNCNSNFIHWQAFLCHWIFITQFSQAKNTKVMLLLHHYFWLLTWQGFRSPCVRHTGFLGASCLTASWRKDSTLRWTPVDSSVRFWMLSTTCTPWASCTETSRCSSPLITCCAYYRLRGGHPWFFSMLKAHRLSTKPLNLLNPNDSKSRIAQQNY